MKVSPRFGNAIRRITGDGLRSLKTDFQNATIRSDEPPCFRSGESYRPEAAHTGQCEPRVSLVRSPSSGSGRKHGRVNGRDHHGASEVVSATATSLSDIAQAKNGTGYRRRIREIPCHAAIAGNCSARVIGITGIQIAAAHDPVVRIAKINRECAGSGRANEWSVIGVPGVALIRSGKYPGDVSAACGNPRFPPPLRCDGSPARRE